MLVKSETGEWLNLYAAPSLHPGRNRGAWSSVLVYNENDAVSHNEQYWYATEQTNAGDEPSDTSTKWQLVDTLDTKLRNSFSAKQIVAKDASENLVGVDRDTYAGVVNHGSDSTIARPTLDGPVLWIGSVAPDNSVGDDLWFDITAAHDVHEHLEHPEMGADETIGGAWTFDITPVIEGNEPTTHDGTLTTGEIVQVKSTNPTILQHLSTDTFIDDAGNTPSAQADTRANQPAAGTVGRLYHVTDEDVIERDNGTSWIQVVDLTHRNDTTNPHSVTHAQTNPPTTNPHSVTAAQAGAVENVAGAQSLEADTRANQPAAGTAGRFYHVTDEDVIERDNGTSWLQVIDLIHRNDTTNPHSVTHTQVGAPTDNPHAVTAAQAGAVENIAATPSIQADTRANQPGAGTAGRLYHVTDEDVIERDNGTSWIQVVDLTHRNDTVNPHSVTAAQTSAVENISNTPSFQGDTRANQPAAGTAGRFYYVTDEDVLERDNGTSWVLIYSGTYAKALAHDSVWLAPGRNSGQATLNNERMTVAPVYIGATGQTITNLGVIVESAGETDSVIRLGVYANDDSNGKPGALLLDAGTVASDTTGRKTIATSLDVAAQWVWLAAVQQGASSTPCDAATWDELTWGMSFDSLSNFDFGYYAWRQDNVSGALPDPMSPSANGNRAAAVLAEV